MAGAAIPYFSTGVQFMNLCVLFSLQQYTVVFGIWRRNTSLRAGRGKRF